MSLLHDEATYDHETVEDFGTFRAVPDLRGTPVEDASGITIGQLYGALAETGTGLLRYLDLDLGGRARHVLVPIGHVRVREAHDGVATHIRLRAALLEDLEQVPDAPDVSAIDDPFERELLSAYGRTFHGERYYAHPAYDHRGLYIDDHLVVPETDTDARPLMALSYLRNWRVAEGEPDVRGWRLHTGPSSASGSPESSEGADGPVVRELIVDPGARRVRYLVIELPGGAARMLPIGYVTLDRAAERVIANGISLEDLIALPPYDGGGVSRDDEELLSAALRARLEGPRRHMLADFHSR